jgi:hypothetical protein
MPFGSAAVAPLTPTLSPVAGGEGVAATGIAVDDGMAVDPLSRVLESVGVRERNGRPVVSDADSVAVGETVR